MDEALDFSFNDSMLKKPQNKAKQEVLTQNHAPKSPFQVAVRPGAEILPSQDVEEPGVPLKITVPKEILRIGSQ